MAARSPNVTRNTGFSFAIDIVRGADYTTVKYKIVCLSDVQASSAKEA